MILFGGVASALRIVIVFTKVIRGDDGLRQFWDDGEVGYRSIKATLI
jgi:hypothetical protein